MIPVVGPVLGAVAGTTAGLLAAEQPTPLDFTTYGISGAVIAAIILGWLWPKPAVDRILASEARAIARAETLETTLKDDVVPILREVARATGPGSPLEKIADKVEKIERRLDTLGSPRTAS